MIQRLGNIRPKRDGYIQYRPDDGVVMIGRTGDSDWVELIVEKSRYLGFVDGGVKL